MIQNAIKTPINPLLTHFIFESLCVLIRKVHLEWSLLQFSPFVLQAYTSVPGGLDKYVFPIIELILTNDVVDFVPYALQIIGMGS